MYKINNIRLTKSTINSQLNFTDAYKTKNVYTVSENISITRITR